MEFTSRLPHFWLQVTVGLLIVMNAVDGVLTILWVDSGRLTEANPMMEILLSTHPVLFMTVKLTLVCLGTLLLWRLRHLPVAIFSIFLCFAAYLSVVVYHLGIMNRMLLTGVTG